MKTPAIATNTWQLYSAKNQLSRIVELTARAPQTITVRGKNAAVLIAYEDYQKLIKPKRSIDCLSGYLDDDDVPLFERDTSACLNQQLTLVTRNKKDFSDINGLSIVNPWE
jgi:prevent-host-death family protein